MDIIEEAKARTDINVTESLLLLHICLFIIYD